MSAEIQQGQNILPPSQDSIYEALTSLQTSDPQTYQAIVRIANPPAGIGGFLFDIPGDDEIRLRSQVTNYFLENNKSVQDNVAVEPATMTLRGLVAELSLGIPLNPPVQTSADALPILPAMTPPQTPQQNQNSMLAAFQAAVAKASAQGQAEADGTSQSLYQYFGNPAGVTKQTSAFLYFRELQTGQQLVSVETPWGIFPQCAIIEVRVMQDARSKYVSDFTVTFQEMRFSGDATVQTGQLAGRNDNQMAPTVQDGSAGQTAITTEEVSPLFPWAGKGGA